VSLCILYVLVKYRQCAVSEIFIYGASSFLTVYAYTELRIHKKFPNRGSGKSLKHAGLAIYFKYGKIGLFKQLGIRVWILFYVMIFWSSPPLLWLVCKLKYKKFQIKRNDHNLRAIDSLFKPTKGTNLFWETPPIRAHKHMQSIGVRSQFLTQNSDCVQWLKGRWFKTASHKYEFKNKDLVRVGLHSAWVKSIYAPRSRAR